MMNTTTNNNHYSIETVSKPVLVKTFGLTEANAKLIHKHRKTFQMIYDAESLDTGIDVRTLWNELGKPEGDSQFNRWFTKQIADLLLVQGIDYEPYTLLDKMVEQNAEPQVKDNRGGHNKKDYIVTVSTAKELCLTAKGEAGKAYRQYFIAAEKLLRKLDSYNPPRLLSKDNQKKLRHYAAKTYKGFNDTSKQFIASINSLVCLHATGKRPRQWEKEGNPNPQNWLEGAAMAKYHQVQEVTIKAITAGTDIETVKDSLRVLFPVEVVEDAIA
ncbi:antA/AntB antirepressor family protein [Endozoicomonas sp. SESOKO2]|uniref:antA/AntB antirepressor family protein n=1 Tax=Endozoicomonas sp. SESOKO2 TaxID=2828743 RepID=UPI00214786AC|nr:antA/AntB antirepressor family protein [Endozoicomonas sp. SESOKO2]